MPSPDLVPGVAERILELAVKDRSAAARALAGQPLELQIELVCETPVAMRARLLQLLPEPERVIPKLPEAELCFTAKAVGLADAGWILEHATDEQIVAAVDLDAWQAATPDVAALRDWLLALSDAGRDTLLRGAVALDPELLVLLLKSRIEVWLKPVDDSWEPPAQTRTLEGQFYFRARSPGDDLEDVEALLGVLFESDYWLYFRLLQGVIWELQSDTEEWEFRWRSGRLEDLGFPPWEEAMGIYAYLRPDQRAAIPEAETVPRVEAWRLPVWLPRLPAKTVTRHPIFRAIQKLGDDERRSCFYAFVALANKVAVADRLALGDAETIPRAVEKAAAVASLGLEFVASENRIDPTDVLKRVSLDRLFQVGAALDPTSRPPLASEP